MSNAEKGFYIRQPGGEMKYLNYLFNFDEFKPESSLIYTFRLIPGSGGNFICDNSGLMCANYDSTREKLTNLNLVNKNTLTDEDSALWLVHENSDGTVTIRNKKYQDVVWTSFKGNLPFSRAVVEPLKSGDTNQTFRFETAN